MHIIYIMYNYLLQKAWIWWIGFFKSTTVMAEQQFKGEQSGEHVSKKLIKG